MAIILLLFSFSAGHLFYYQLIYLEMDVNEVSKKKYGPIFVQSYQLGKYVRSKTNRCERIFEWGSEPGVYYYSNRDSASNVFYTPHLNLGRPKTILKKYTKLLKDIRSSPPSFIIWNNDYGTIHDNMFSYFKNRVFKRFLEVFLQNIPA